MCYDDERKVVEELVGNGVDICIVDLVDFVGVQVFEVMLLVDEVLGDDEVDEVQVDSGVLVDERIVEEEVFDDFIVLIVYVQIDVQDGLLLLFRSQIILFIWIGDEGVVGGYYGDVEMDEVVEEGVFVGISIGSGDYDELVYYVFIDVMIIWYLCLLLV